MMTTPASSTNLDTEAPSSRSSLLRESVLAASLGHEDLVRLQGLGEVTHVAAGAVVVEAGTASDWLHQFDPQATKEDIRGILGQMLFKGEEGLKKTDALSGGEAARLLFCKIMLQKPNVLVLDEPTNHLDLEAINALNQAIQKYEGTVFLVTHDQDLIEEAGTRVWHFEGGPTDFHITDHKGPYEEYMSHAKQTVAR